MINILNILNILKLIYKMGNIMGNILTIDKKHSVYRINYEDVQYGIELKNIILINTLDSTKQSCLIKNTIFIEKEESIINKLIVQNTERTIIIYGENSQDTRPYEKYKQLMNLGFTNVHVYCGGLFEWLLLQDIYGCELFKTNSFEKDHLQYKGDSRIANNMIKC